MTATLLFAALLATTPASPEAMTAFARAEADVATARQVQAACWSPRECEAADKLVEAAEDAYAAVWRLTGGDGAPDPFAADSDPFRDDWPQFAGTMATEDDVQDIIAEYEQITGERVVRP